MTRPGGVFTIAADLLLNKFLMQAEPIRLNSKRKTGSQYTGQLIIELYRLIHTRQQNFALDYNRISLYNVSVMQRLDAAFAALADPTRRAILARLARGEATVNELAEPFKMTQPAISRHLKVLEDARLIVCRVDGTRRPRRLAKAGVDAMEQWLVTLRKALEANYDRIDQVLTEFDQPQKGDKR